MEGRSKNSIWEKEIIKDVFWNLEMSATVVEIAMIINFMYKIKDYGK